MGKGVFHDIKVADFSWGITGPLTAKYLADHGATVVRVEATDRPCITRLVGPYADGKPGVNRAGYFAFENANKYSLSVNLKNKKGLELAEKLILWADVIVESFRPGVMDKLGLGYEDARRINPDIIYVQTSTLGKSGPYHSYGGFGTVLVALCGFSHLTGYSNEEPLPFPHAYTDFISPRFIGSALIAALIHRRKTGKGQFIDGSQIESSLWFLMSTILDYTANNRQGSRQGNISPSAAPHGVYRCQGDDRWIAITVSDDKMWQSFCHTLGNPPWTQEPDFATPADRKKNEAELNTRISEWTVNYPPEDIMQKLQSAGVPAGVVRNAVDLIQDAELKDRGALWVLPHEEMGPFTHLGQPFRLSKTPAEGRRASPRLGMHNEYVCSEILGISDAEFVDLLESGAF